MTPAQDPPRSSLHRASSHLLSSDTRSHSSHQFLLSPSASASLTPTLAVHRRQRSTASASDHATTRTGRVAGITFRRLPERRRHLPPLKQDKSATFGTLLVFRVSCARRVFLLRLACLPLPCLLPSPNLHVYCWQARAERGVQRLRAMPTERLAPWSSFPNPFFLSCSSLCTPGGRCHEVLMASASAASGSIQEHP